MLGAIFKIRTGIKKPIVGNKRSRFIALLLFIIYLFRLRGATNE